MFLRRKLYKKSTRENVGVPFVNTEPSMMAGKYLQGKCRFKVFVLYHQFMTGAGSDYLDIIILTDEGDKKATSQSTFLVCLIYNKQQLKPGNVSDSNVALNGNLLYRRSRGQQQGRCMEPYSRGVRTQSSCGNWPTAVLQTAPQHNLSQWPPLESYTSKSTQVEEGSNGQL